MDDRTVFLKKLSELLLLAQGQENQITVEEVRAFFSKDALTEEQMMLMFDYLLAQKVTVKGYIKVGAEDEPEEKHFPEEDEAYLREYERELQNYAVLTEEERPELYRKASAGDAAAMSRLMEGYLHEVLAIAKEMYRPEVFIGDLIQEGSLGLVLGVEQLCGGNASEMHELILQEVRQCMQRFLEEQTELASRDKKMVEKVQALDHAIQELTEELGRKVAIEELAVYMGMEIEEIEDILKLAGEDTEENEEGE